METSLREKQSLFVSCLGQLYVFVNLNGWQLTLGDAYRPDNKGHMPNSLHYSRLAQDLNLFVDGEWVIDGEHPAWLRIGQFWESLNPLCRWGGRFNDANHFSLEHEGVS